MELDGIAIIGMSGRFPGAKNVQQFWQNLIQGKDCISRFSPEQLEFSVLGSQTGRNNRRTVSARGILDDVDQFDAEFFGIYPKEAELMDPQHRVFLECAWESLEVAGYNPFEYSGMIGVFASSSLNTYLLHNLASDGKFAGKLAGNYQVGEYQAMLGNDKDFMPTRVSYKLNLKGPSMSIQTACSSSLVAISQACNSLLSYGCDMALAGGVSITFPQRRDYFYEEEGLASSDGVCRTFDAGANGTVFGHGCGVLLLKRLSDAVADGDTVLAVIKGTAINNDGFEKIGYAAPSVNAQAEVIAMAQATANVLPDSISYIEAHGTGTPLGDPIEIAALTKAFRDGGADGTEFCAIGSGKPNISHLDVASGAVGLIKTVIQLQNEMIPPLLHFTAPNPNIDFKQSPFYPVTKPTPWLRSEEPRRAGISAFGVGGTNAHVILEEAPIQDSDLADGPVVLPLSARNENALKQMRENLADRLEQDPKLNLADVAYTLQLGRKAFSHRAAIVGTDRQEVIAALRDPAGGLKSTAESDLPVVFMFPGQGAQYVDMGRELYQREPAFRQAVDQCAEILKKHLQLDIRTVLYPDGDAECAEAARQINETSITQPAIFVIEYAMAQQWIAWGIKPSAVVGHSIGEYVCAVVSGTFTLEEALELLSVRAKLMHALPGGSMLGVRLSAQEVAAILPEGLSIAADNSVKLCTISGPTPLIEAFKAQLESQKVACRLLATSHAFHSSMMDGMLEQFTAVCSRFTRRSPTVQWISTCTGQAVTSQDLSDPAYWSRQLRQTVRFADAIQTVSDRYKTALFIEVGPGQALAQFVRQHPVNVAAQRITASMVQVEGSQNDLNQSLTALAKAWTTGAKPDWKSLHQNHRRLRVPLPTYPFQRSTYWVDNSRSAVSSSHVLQTAPGEVSVDSTCQGANECSQPTAISTARMNERVNATEATPIATLSSQTEAVVASAPAIVNKVPVKEKIAAELRAIILNLSGNPVKDDDVTFIDMGFDSLFLAQASQAIDSRFSFKITFRQLLGDLSTISRIAALLETKLPAEMFAEAPEREPIDDQSTATLGLSGQQSLAFTQPTIGAIQNPGDVQRMLDSHVQNLQKLLEASRRAPAGSSSSLRTVYKPNASTDSNTKANEVKRFGPYKPLEKGEKGGLTDHQQAALDRLIERYITKTSGSKSYTTEHRPHFADPRAVSGFRSQWKEMVYPIVSARSKGARIWDVDGNEYIDITMGFGTYFFGHSPDWLIKAIEKQLHTGIEIGPQSPLAGRVAKKIADFTGLERVTFCNTGSEAVMAAMRLARTVTGRNRIVYFSGDYHGMFEEVLVRGAWPNGQYKAQPIAPGIPASLVENILVLDYGSPEALEIIKEHRDEIAAVMIEPVQSRNPGLQPREFMHQVRSLTQEIGAALIFDEVVTGFRCHPGGAQAYFGVKADMATYGKVVGGGMPIGILAGSSTFMDALDGGQWQYGDDSFPEVGMTFFAGTFVRHPLAIAAADAVLDFLKESGPELQASIFKRVTNVCESVNRHMEELQVPIRMSSFSAFAAIDYASDLKFASLLWYYMREKGIHIWEGRPCYFTTAHTDEDLSRFVEVFRESVEQMQADGFLPQRGDSSLTSLVDPKDYETADRFPLADGQREMWLGAQMSPEAAGPHHACNAFVFEGPLDVEALRRALDVVVGRHEGLRCTFSEDGTHVIVHSSVNIELPLIDLSNLDQDTQHARIQEFMLAGSRKIFDLTTGPLLSTQLLKLAPEKHQLIVAAQMIACDGWSHYVLFEELSEIYSAIRENRASVLRPVVPMRRYALWQREYLQTQAAKECEQFWLSKFDTVPTPLDLPTKASRPLTRTVSADRRDILLSNEFYDQIKQFGRGQKSSSFAVLLTAFQVWLHQLSGAQDIVVGVPFSEQSTLGFETLVGQCANTLPIRAKVESGKSFSDLLKNAWDSLLDAQENTHYTFGRLISKLDISHDPSRIPLVSVIFNIDPAMTKVHFSGLRHRFFAGPRVYFQFDLGFNLVEEADGLRLECDFNSNLFDSDTVQEWLNGFECLLRQIVNSGSDATVNKLSLLEYPSQAMLRASESALEVISPIQALKLMAQSKSDSIAWIEQDRKITTQQFLQKVNSYAQVLRDCLANDSVSSIAIVADRSIQSACTLLAAMKLGVTVIPISSSSDAANQLQELSKQTGSMLVVVDNGAKILGQAKNHGQLLSFIELDEKSSSASGDYLEDRCLQSTLLLSPSMKAPAGTLTIVESSSLMQRVAAMRNSFELGQHDVAAWTSPVGSIEFMMQLLIPICSGSPVAASPDTNSSSGKLFASWMTEYGITWLNATASQIRQLIGGGFSETERLQVVFNHELLSDDLVARICKRSRRTWQVLGLAETCGWIACGPLQLGSQAALGSAVNEVAVAVVNENSKIVPTGVPGRLMIAGAVASGYKNAAELSNKRFMEGRGDFNWPVLLTNISATRLTDGRIKIASDEQSRALVQGKELDLGFVGEAIRQHSSVIDAAVMLRDDLSDEVKLIAYVSTAGDQVVENPSKLSRELKQYLRGKIANHNLPAAFVFVPELPLDAFGHIDCAKLQLLVVDLQSGVESDQASTATQEKLVGIWRDVLKLDKFGIHDNFFQLGGQSLQAVKVFAQIESQFGRKLPLATLFHSPTISQLAEILDDASGSKQVGWSSLIPIQSQGNAKPLFLVHGAGGNVLLYHALSKRLAPNHPLYGLQSQGLDGQSPPLSTIEEMAAHYLKEIRAVQPVGPYYLGGYCLGGTIAYEMAQQLLQSGEKVALVAMLDTYNFSLALKSSMLGFLMQKIRFHLGNIIGLRPRHLVEYIKEKFRVAKDGEFANLFTSRPGFDVEAGRATSGVELKIQTLNDTAAETYRPKPYAGKLTLLKPHINYKFYPDPKMGWEGLALGGLDIVEFPFNPHAMLAEPYVEQLADALIDRLEGGRESSSDTGIKSDSSLITSVSAGSLMQHANSVDSSQANCDLSARASTDAVPSKSSCALEVNSR